MNHIPYPSIEQYRHAIKRVTDTAQFTGLDTDQSPLFDRSLPLPKLKYQATVKLHGTNFAMGLDRKTGEIWFQSRESIITPEKDNAGAARFFSSKDLMPLFDKIPGDTVVIYGEWCGKGIQSKVGICQLPKMLVVFDVFVESENRWLSAEEASFICAPDIPVYNIYNFPKWEIEIDFADPAAAQAELERITTEIADSCPVSKAFGADGIGEGAVWRCVTPGWEDPKFRFKVKDERHSAKDKPVVVDNSGDAEIVAKLTPEWRLEQMLEKVCDLNNGGEVDIKKVSLFLQAFWADVQKEDFDILNQLKACQMSRVKSAAVGAARMYFVNRYKQV